MPKVPERQLSYGEIIGRDKQIKRTLENVKAIKKRERLKVLRQSHKVKQDYKKIGKRMSNKIRHAVKDYYETINKLRELR